MNGMDTETMLVTMRQSALLEVQQITHFGRLTMTIKEILRGRIDSLLPFKYTTSLHTISSMYVVVIFTLTSLHLNWTEFLYLK